MLSKLPGSAIVFAFALISASRSVHAAAAITSREDVTAEVYIPDGQSVTEFCETWQDECVLLAQNAGTPYDVCGAGYIGPGTARVDCLAVTSPTTDIKYTEQVADALGVQFA